MWSVGKKALSVGSLEPRLFEGEYWICDCIHMHTQDDKKGKWRIAKMELRLTDLRDGESGIITSIKIGH
ncbi:hypothetical protein KAU87_05700, partial [Candidatus Bathyarchaeota archaeon]|nr:hypothetical protein [Candidatus Bathyarchaeota archaeon]